MDLTKRREGRSRELQADITAFHFHDLHFEFTRNDARHFPDLAGIEARSSTCGPSPPCRRMNRTMMALEIFSLASKYQNERTRSLMKMQNQNTRKEETLGGKGKKARSLCRTPKNFKLHHEHSTSSAPAQHTRSKHRGYHSSATLPLTENPTNIKKEILHCFRSPTIHIIQRLGLYSRSLSATLPFPSTWGSFTLPFFFSLACTEGRAVPPIV